LSLQPARLPWGARRFASRALFAGALLAVAALARAERIEGPAPWRVGGRAGFSLDACALPDSAGWTLEVSLRVPPATISTLDRDRDGNASLRAVVRVKSRSRGVLESTQEFGIAATDTALGQGKVLLVSFPGVSGPYEVRARLTDLLSHRVGLIHPGSDNHVATEITGSSSVPESQGGRDLGDLEFLWPVTAAAAPPAFVREGRVLVPNPDRLYGLMAGEMRARFVARGRRGDDGKPWRWEARVLDAAGTVIARSESSGVAGRQLDAEVGFDLSREPAGAYTLEIKASQEEGADPGALLRRSRFSVGWQPDTWTRSAADIADEVHFLLSADEEEAFATTPPGEQERQLEAFWARRDPTPNTAENEALRTFRTRVAHANEAYGRVGTTKGMFTDMGRVYIRYGEPGEVLHQVIPTGNETLTQELQAILDKETRSPEDVRQHSLGGDQRAFEVWTYEGDISLPVDADPRDETRGRSRRRLVFLFVDEQGTGTYRLRYSTE
jgi:GWxTD domain-containing protein